MITRAYTDALEASLGRVVGDMQRQFQVYVAQSDAVIAQLQARATEAELRFTALEKATSERLESAVAESVAKVAAMAADRPDPADVAATVKALIDGAVAEAVRGLPEPVVPDVAPMVAEAVEAAVAAIPAARDGKDADPAELEALRNEIRAVRSEIPAPVELPDLTGFATKDDVEAVRAEIPEVPEQRDWTDEIEAVKALIPAAPEPADLSHLSEKSDVLALAENMSAEMSEFRAAMEQATAATRAELDGVAKSIPAIPEPPDLSEFATKADVEAVRSEIPVVPEARDWTPEIEAAKTVVADAVERMARHPGRFPVVRAYAEGVAYAGDVVTHKGATWQALRDTGREPPHEDWACLSARGEPGQVGKSMVVRGTFDPAEAYAALDVVTRNGSGWVAKHDSPGDCPGDGWQLIASKGGKGDSIKGEPGKMAVVVSASVDDEGVLLLTNADGSTVKADFYEVLRRIAK